MVRDFDKYTNLAKVANGTFGTTGLGTARVSTQSLKFEVIDEHTLKITYQSLVTFASKSMLRDLMHKYKVDAMSMVEGSVDKFVEEYKEQNEDDKVRLQVRDNSVDDSVEYISYSMYSPIQRGFYRLSCLVDVS